MNETDDPLAHLARLARSERGALAALARAEGVSPEDAVDCVQEGLPHAPVAGVDELLSRAEEHVRLRACVAELCEIQKAVVTLRMLEEQPGEDVGAALGIISAGHVAVLLHRAKRALRACMTVPV